MMSKILIIEDDRLFCRMLSGKINAMGHEMRCAYTLEQGLQEALSDAFDIVFLDVHLPDGDGIESIPMFRDVSSSPEIIIMTERGDPKGAELAIRSGVWDYIEKTSSLDEITLRLIRAISFRETRLLNTCRVLEADGIIGSSPGIRRCLDQASMASSTDASVLITGETGTGKELLARAIHKNSKRAGNKFIVVDCASLSQNMAQSILFGHDKGAYTGAVRSRHGLVKLSDKGTLFLDEVGELPMSIQKVFLRVAQEKRFRPLGNSEEIDSDFRIIGATNRNIDSMTKDGSFRKDLLFRLKAITIDIPPLRDRKEDISDIAMNCIKNKCIRSKIPLKTCTPEFMSTIMDYDWPGNVRELINTVDHSLAVSGNNPTIFSRHLPDDIRVKKALSNMIKSSRSNIETGQASAYDAVPTMREIRYQVTAKAEREYLHNILFLTKGDVQKARGIAGLSRARFYELMKKYEINLSEENLL